MIGTTAPSLSGRLVSERARGAQDRPLQIHGGEVLEPFGDGVQSAPEGVGGVRFSRRDGKLQADLTGSHIELARHSVSLRVTAVAEAGPR